MNTKAKTLLIGAALTLSLTATSASAQETRCHITYSLHGWSAIYKHATGSGVIRCDDGQRAHVRIRVNGGGLTAGKWRIDDGEGEFTHVRRLQDVYGSYLSANADAGVVRSAGAQVLTKGDVSLALGGTGHGVNLGVDVGKFTILPEHRR